MPLIEDKFEQSRIDSIKRYLQREAEKGRKKDYEIVVDGFKVVSRTDNLDEFEDYEAELKNGTRNISILVFDGPSTNRNTKYSFYLQGEPTGQAKPLNGLGEIEQIIQEKLDAKDREFELRQLREKLGDAEKALEESEEYNEQLEKRIEELTSRKSLETKNTGELLAAAVGYIVHRNKDKFPMGQELAGLFPDTDVKNLPQPAEETTASFEKRKTGDAFDEDTKNRLSLIADLQSRLDEPQLIGLFTIIRKLTEEPPLIETVIDLLNDKTAPDDLRV